MNALISEINKSQVEPGTLQIWWIGQEGFVFKSHGRIIYIDPYLSTYAEKITKGNADEHVRIKPAPMKPEDVDNADIVLCTHDHADHISGGEVFADTAIFVAHEKAKEDILGERRPTAVPSVTFSENSVAASWSPSS